MAFDVLELRQGDAAVPADVDVIVCAHPSAAFDRLVARRTAGMLSVPLVAAVDDAGGEARARAAGADATWTATSTPSSLLAAIVRAQRPTAAAAPAEDLIAGVPGIVWEADASFRFTFVSDHAERLLGYPAAHWLEQPDFWVGHVHPEDRAQVVAQCKHETALGRDHELEYRMIAADGRAVWLHDVVRVVRVAGEPRLRGVMVETGARIAVERELRAAQARLAHVLTLGGIGTFAVDQAAGTTT